MRTGLLALVVLVLAGSAGCASSARRAAVPPPSRVVASSSTSPSASASASPGASASGSPTTSPGGAAAASAPEPRVDGNRLVDARTGRTWIPRGVDWSSFEYACAQGWGYSALDTLGTGAAERQAAALAAWRIDVVRLPLNQDCWLGTRGAPVSDAVTTRTAQGYRAAVTDFVTALRAHGIVTILDQQSRKRSDSAEFGNLAMPDTDSVSFWTSVASGFRTDPSVMFDAFSEPYSRYDAADRLVFALSWNCWRDGGCTPPTADDHSAVEPSTYQAVGMATLVSTIRAAGARQPILLGGLDYANDLSGWLVHAPHDDQLVAAVHLYDFKPCLAACWSATLLPLSRRVPVLATELGAKDPTRAPGSGFVVAYLHFADAHGLGALFWAWGNDPSDPMSLTTGLLDAPTAYGRVARAWLDSGSPSPSPSG